MRKLRRQIESQVQAVRGNLDTVLLGFKGKKLDRLMSRLEATKKRFERDGDLAMGLALQVLERVKAVRDSLTMASGAATKSRVVSKSRQRRSAKKPGKKPTAKKTTKPSPRKGK